MDELADFRSAQQIHALLVQRGEDIGLATVYRTLGAMATSGEFDVLRTASGETLYRRCERQGHHHHLVCRSCGRAVEVQASAFESLVASLSDETGFVDVSHTLELFGTCATCAEELAAG
ncbi:Fur family transcriptional regulator [Cellulomonas sp.]|nr:Fur family transcriptional regulator [Cellulomonas sp.]